MQGSDESNLLRSEAELVLAQARKEKSDRIKDLGSPIQLTGKALAIVIRDGNAWIAENTTIAKKLDLETGKTLQIYRGHTAPVTCLAFCDRLPGSDDGKILITGSWDKTIKLWNTDTKEMISSTDAHSDFVKTLFVIPSLHLLISGSSDKIVRFWDISTAAGGKPLTSVGSISAHTRPVESIDGKSVSENSGVLFTGDTMGVIKVWEIQKDESAQMWRTTLKQELNHHRTRINEMLYGNEQLWSASSDQMVQLNNHPPLPSDKKPCPPISHPLAVRAILPLSLTPLAEPYLLTGAGDIIRAYDVSSPEDPELLGELDGHWHDVTALRLWVRTSVGEDSKIRVEPWIVSASLDSTIRKWRLSELLKPMPTAPAPAPPPPPPIEKIENRFQMTEDEERELAELLDDD